MGDGTGPIKKKNDAFAYVRADQFLGLKRPVEENEVTLKHEYLERFPFQPARPSHHPALDWSYPFAERRHFLGELLVTDDAYHAFELQSAIERNIETRIFSRWLDEYSETIKHARNWVAAEDMRRTAFFQKAQHQAAAQHRKYADARTKDFHRLERVRDYFAELGLTRRDHQEQAKIEEFGEADAQRKKFKKGA